MLWKKKKHGYPEEWVHRLQKVKYVLLAFLLLSCMTGFYSKLQGMSPWDVFSMLTTGRLPKSTYIVGTVLLILIMAGMCTQERFFASFSVPWEQYLQSCRSSREHFSNEIVQTVHQSVLSVRRDVRHIWILTAILHIQNASAVTPALQSAQGKIFIQALLMIKISNC